MELAVLLKAVPRSESVRCDPLRHTVDRSGVELVVNPFDQRALRVALELRRPGERVTVVSLGPPAAGPFLREARAVGADRAVHLCDPAFAGSDLLATSAALASALRPLAPGLILAGTRSTDGDTGLVGPQVAVRLGMPVVSRARAIRRVDGRSWLEADVDTPTGWTSVEVEPPAVVTVGEKIAKPLLASPEQFARVGPESVESVGPSSLGLSEAEVGAFGSPTSVEEVRPVAPSRLARTFASGTASDRVREAVAALAPLLAQRPAPPPPLPWPPAQDPDREIVVLVTGPLGEVEPGALGVVTHLRRALPSYTISAAAYSATVDRTSRRRLEEAGALAGYLLDPGSSRFDSGDAAHGLASLLEHRPKVAAVVCVALPFGGEVAGQLAAARSLGAVTDAVGVRASDEGVLSWSKPSIGGSSIATVRCRSTPTVATVPVGLSAPATDGRSEGGLAWTPVRCPSAIGRVRRGIEHAEPSGGPEVDGAEVVVAVGTGIGGPEGIARLLPTVRRWGAALAATRRVVDAGWVPARLQVGLTGRALAPRLAVLLGVRGVVNHMVGWGRAGAVLAVNRDPEAPVFRQADAGIIGTVEEVVPELAEPLARALGPPPRT